MGVLLVLPWLNGPWESAGRHGNTNPVHFHLGIRTYGGPDHFIGILPADPKSDLSVPLHPDLILGSVLLGPSSVPTVHLETDIRR